jgi:hypothetical protein
VGFWLPRSSLIRNSYLNPVNYSRLFDQTARPHYDNYPAFAIHQTLYSLLSGSIAPDGRLVERDTSGLGSSALVDPIPFPNPPSAVMYSVAPQKPVKNLREAMEELHRKITIGLLSLAPELVYSETTDLNVQVRVPENVWSYDRRVLLILYGVVIFADLVTVSVGIHCMSQNGGCTGLGFMRTIAMTRASPRLDTAVGSWSSGFDPIPNEAQDTKIMYGEMVDGSQRQGYGVVGEVSTLRQS